MKIGKIQKREILQEETEKDKSPTLDLYLQPHVTSSDKIMKENLIFNNPMFSL